MIKYSTEILKFFASFWRFITVKICLDGDEASDL